MMWRGVAWRGFTAWRAALGQKHVCTPADRAWYVDVIDRKFGKLNILVCNAGYTW